MAHIGQKFGLGPVGGFSLIARIGHGGGVALLLGHVLQDSQQSGGSAGPVTENLARRGDPSHAAVGFDAIFGVQLPALVGVAQAPFRHDPAAVIRMDPDQHILRTAHQRRHLMAQQGRRSHMVEDARTNIAVEHQLVGDVDGQLQSFLRPLGFAQGRHQVRDVVGHDEDAVDLALGAAPGNKLQPDADLGAVKALGADGVAANGRARQALAQGVGPASDQIGKGFVQQAVAEVGVAHAHFGAKSRIDPHIAHIPVHKGQGDGRMVHEGGQQGVGGGPNTLGLCQARHVPATLALGRDSAGQVRQTVLQPGVEGLGRVECGADDADAQTVRQDDRGADIGRMEGIIGRQGGVGEAGDRFGAGGFG